MERMRLLKREETNRRCCKICADMKTAGVKHRENAMHCPHKKCPYTELDKYENYNDYLKATEDRWAFLKMLGKG